MAKKKEQKIFNPRPYMKLAVAEMNKGKNEPRPDGKVPLKVGAVLVFPDEKVIQTHRVELHEGDHAEFTLLERKLGHEKLDECINRWLLISDKLKNMKYLILILLFISTITYGQVEKYNYPDTLMIYGKATDDYGFSPNNPIKVGGGVLPKHIYRYLNSLTDSNGVKMKFKRLGSCCSKEIGRDKPLTMFKVFTNDSNEVTLYFDNYQWDYPQLIRTAKWEEKRKGYHGEYLNDTVFHGYGIYFYEDGGYYQGYWQNGIMEGLGKMVVQDQEIYIGNFRIGEYHGKGRIEYKDGGKYVGEWGNGRKEGHGILYYPKGLEIISIEGKFENDKPKGKFKVVYQDGKIKQHEF